MDIDKLIKKRTELVNKGVDELKVRVIGQHVIDLIAQNGDISVALLLESFRVRLLDPKNDTDRLLTEAARDCLQELINRRC